MYKLLAILLTLPFNPLQADRFLLAPEHQVTNLSMATVSVEPESVVYDTTELHIGDTYMDSIYVSNITDTLPLYGWQFEMSFNPGVLHCVSVTEGPFLKQGGQTFFIPPIYIDNTIGKIGLCGCCLLGQLPGVTGSGTVAYITWQVAGLGNSILHLEDVILADPSTSIIPCDVVDGYFELWAPGVEETSTSQYEMSLENYPNPFSKNTVIRYSASDGLTKNPDRSWLTIYDLTGRLVRIFSINDLRFTINEIQWDGDDDNRNRLPSGIYLCRLQGGEDTVVKQLLMLK